MKVELSHLSYLMTQKKMEDPVAFAQEEQEIHARRSQILKDSGPKRAGAQVA